MAIPTTGLWIPNVTQANDIDWENLSVALVKVTWDPDLDAVAGQAGWAAHECSGTGYTAGGKSLLTTVTRSGGQFLVTADSGDIVWTSSTITEARHAVFYDPDSTTPVADAVAMVYTFEDDLANDGGDFTVPLQSSPVADTICSFNGVV